MKINDATVNLVKAFEGKKLKAYRDPVGVWTIGYGHSEYAPFPPKPKAGMQITEKEAEALLRKGLEHFGDDVRKRLTRDATDNEFGAMVSLAYNVGIGNFETSTCLKRFNAGDVKGASEALQWFNKAGGKTLRGLVRRRKAEAALMLTPDADAPPKINPGLAAAIVAAVVAVFVFLKKKVWDK